MTTPDSQRPIPQEAAEQRPSKTLILATGTPSEKVIRGKIEKVTPIVYAQGQGFFSEVGVGITTSEGGYVWGLLTPHNLIQSWRAMKMLEQLPEIMPDGTLAAAWETATPYLHASDERYLDDLRAVAKGKVNIDTIREQLLQTTPKASEVEDMVRALKSQDIHFGTGELEREIRERRLNKTPYLEQVITEEKAAREKLLRELGHSEKPRRWERVKSFFHLS